MSKEWLLTEGSTPFQRWYRSSNQVVIEVELGKPPVLRCDIFEVTVYEGSDPIIKKIGTIEISATNLTEDEALKALWVQEFFTEIIGRHALPFIKNYLNPTEVKYE